MDDIDQTDVNLSGEETAIEESSTQEQTTEEVPLTEPEATAEGTEEKTETEETHKKGAQTRIRELNAKAKSAEERAQSLEQKLAELTNQVDSVQEAPFVPQVDANGEISQDQYKRDVQTSAMSAAQLLIKQNNAINRINQEAKEAVQKYAQLDPDSELFDKELSDSVTEATEALVRANPYTASPKKFVDSMMKPYLRSVTKEVGKVTENLAKQVSETATRPTSVSTKGGKANHEKSIEELEAELGIYVS